MLPSAFTAQMQAILAADYPAFEAALSGASPISVRYNPFKNSQLARQEVFAPIPWHPDGYYLQQRPVFTLDPSFHAGAYYVQEASSMFLYEALRQTVDVTQDLKVLDLCAAPGGKSTLIASMLTPGSLLVANEVIRSRTSVLRENLEKWGCPNTATTSAEAEELAGLNGFFDVVVADAPCSGEGMFRKDPNAIGEWSPANVDLCAARQRRIIAAAVDCLAPGGVLIYSTCTYNRAENEENAAWFVETLGLEAVSLQIPAAWGITETDGGYRFYPHKTQGEGFFLAAFRKIDGDRPKAHYPATFRSLKPLAKNLVPEMAHWVENASDYRFFQLPSGEVLTLLAALEGHYLLLDKSIKNKWFGVPIGEFKGKDFAPGHALALSNACAAHLPKWELDRDLALRYLKKETFAPEADTPKGWTLAQYGGLSLGWMKVLPNRMNNYFPQERRIRMEI